MSVEKNYNKAINLQSDQGELTGVNLVNRVSSELIRLQELKILLKTQDKNINNSKLLNEVNCELIRLKGLNIPLEVQHVTNPVTDIEPREYDTNFKAVINTHKAVKQTVCFLEAQRKQFEMDIISDEISKIDKLVLIDTFIEANELNSHAMFNHGLSIGLHNGEMFSSHYTKAGIKKVQSEQLKAINRFDRKYGLAMSFMRDVLLDFYQEKANHSFKPALVIEQIDNLCIANKIAFPKDRNGKDYRSIYKTIMSFIPPNPDWMKKTKKEFSQINANDFKIKYEKGLIQLRDK